MGGWSAGSPRTPLGRHWRFLPHPLVSFNTLRELTWEIDGWAPFAFLLESLGHQIHFALGFCVCPVSFHY